MASAPKRALADFLSILLAEPAGEPAPDGAADTEISPASAGLPRLSSQAFSAPVTATSGHEGRAAPPLKLGLAVSGGGDSVALLRLMAEIAREGSPCPIQIFVYTVDHQLRPEAAAEAAWVGALAAELGAPHRSLTWRWQGRGNISEAARQGRYRAIAEACRADGVAHCLLGHTRDDNIETLFLGLMRGAGLDGLAGMRRSFTLDGLRFHRPWLEISRSALREELLQRGQDWHEDPTNQDLTHDRARVRQMLAALDLPSERLAQSLGALAATRRDLGTELLSRLKGAVGAEGPVLCIDAEALLPLTPELRRRALAAAIKVVGRGGYAPRAAQLARLVARDWRGDPSPVTLGGCRLWFARGALRLTREFAAVPAPVPADQSWDGWRLIGPAGNDSRLAAVGEAGRAQLEPSWRAARIPAAAISASPALWQGEAILASAYAKPKSAEIQPLWQFQGPDLPASFTRAVMAH